MYETALQKLGLTADKVWYCGDSREDDIYGANNVGMFPVLYEGRTKNDRDNPDFEYLRIHNRKRKLNRKIGSGRRYIMALEKVYDYFHNYDKQTYQVVACMGNEPSEQDIKDFENQYGINLPADFREFTMSPLGGLYMEVQEEIWPRAKLYDIGPFWSFCRGIIVYGIANEIPDFLDIREKTKELHDEGFTDFIPFLSIIGNGDEIFCFDKDNNIVLLDCYATGEATPVEGTFSDCLMNQIAELEERKNKKIRGEDKFG